MKGECRRRLLSLSPPVSVLSFLTFWLHLGERKSVIVVVAAAFGLRW